MKLKNPMTRAGYKKLAAEYEHLTKVERPQVVKGVADAADKVFAVIGLAKAAQRASASLKELSQIKTPSEASVATVRAPAATTRNLVWR